jgi:hypothetical protein
VRHESINHFNDGDVSHCFVGGEPPVAVHSLKMA